jgi:hypothetical protein
MGLVAQTARHPAQVGHLVLVTNDNRVRVSRQDQAQDIGIGDRIALIGREKRVQVLQGIREVDPTSNEPLFRIGKDARTKADNSQRKGLWHALDHRDHRGLVGGEYGRG